MAEGFARNRLSSREAGQLYAAWRTSTAAVRERLLNEPQLFLKTQREHFEFEYLVHDPLTALFACLNAGVDSIPSLFSCSPYLSDASQFSELMSGQYSLLNCNRSGLGAVADLQFADDSIDVITDGEFTDGENTADVFVRQAFGEQL